MCGKEAGVSGRFVASLPAIALALALVILQPAGKAIFLAEEAQGNIFPSGRYFLDPLSCAHIIGAAPAQ